MKNIKNYNEFVNEGAETTGTVGSGTNVSGGAQGSFTSAAGTSISGGDSGSAFSTNSNTSGMGTVHSAQPSNSPGSVWGKDSKPGSGDISKGHLGPFTKLSTMNKIRSKKGKKRKNDYATKGAHIDKFYTTKYVETYTNDGKIITNWKTFNEKYK